MRSKLKHWFANLALATVSLAAVLAFCEFVVFGMILVPDDVLPNVTINNVVRYEPGRTAVWDSRWQAPGRVSAGTGGL